MEMNYDSTYQQYPCGTMVKIKYTGEVGEAFENLFDTISVFIDERCEYFSINDVEFMCCYNK